MNDIDDRERGSDGQAQGGGGMREGWQIRKLGDVCSLLNRGVSPTYLEKGGVCVLNQKCIRNHEVSYEPARRHDDAAKKVAEDRFVQRGDVLVNSTGTGTLGRVAQVRNEPEEATTVDSHVTIVRAKPGLFHLEFFGYMLVVIEEAIKEAGDGCGGQTELARSVLAERFSVSYPESLPEQQRIVALLDEAFAGLATAKANAERNLQNARALFESHLQSVFSQRGEGWPTKQLGEVCDFQGGSQPPKSEFVYEPRAGYVRFLQIRDYASDRHLTYIPESSKNRLCNADDIMIGRYGASVGKILTGRAGAYNVALVKTIPDLRVLDRDFFFNYLASGAFQGCLADVAARSAQNGFSKDDIYGFPVPAPPLSEQRMVIEQLNPLEVETQHLTHLYERKLAALEELKKTLLHQAFNGEL